MLNVKETNSRPAIVEFTMEDNADPDNAMTFNMGVMGAEGIKSLREALEDMDKNGVSLSLEVKYR